MDHAHFMHRCLELADLGRGEVGNGALVGAVLVRDGNVIAEGWHKGFGRPHAESDLLSQVQDVHSTDVLYVNLEPCCHEGKTPPCTDLLIKRGAKTVVIGMLDPDRRVAGQGIVALREAGVSVTGPVLPQECAWLNRGFISMRTAKRPWITLKVARTRNGEIAAMDGSPMKITTQAQDAWAHAHLRAQHDAIIVGVGTIISDNPLLNTRFVQNTKVEQKIPYTIVFDKNCNVLKNSRIFQESPERRIIVVDESASQDKVSTIANLGARVVRVACDETGAFVWSFLWDALCTPRDTYTGMTSVLVEGGRRTWDRFKLHGYDAEVILVGT